MCKNIKHCIWQPKYSASVSFSSYPYLITIPRDLASISTLLDMYTYSLSNYIYIYIL